MQCSGWFIMLYLLSVWQVVGMQGWSVGRSGRCTLWWNWSVGVGRGAGQLRAHRPRRKRFHGGACVAQKKRLTQISVAVWHECTISPDATQRRRSFRVGRGRSNLAICNQHACALHCGGFNQTVSHTFLYHLDKCQLCHFIHIKVSQFPGRKYLPLWRQTLYFYILQDTGLFACYLK